MDWAAYCKVCELFLAHSAPDELTALSLGRKHAFKEKHSVIVGLWSCPGGRFIFTPIKAVRLAYGVRGGAPRPSKSDRTMQMRLFNDEEDQGNLWDNIVKALEEDA